MIINTLSVFCNVYVCINSGEENDDSGMVRKFLVEEENDLWGDIRRALRKKERGDQGSNGEKTARQNT